MKTPRTIKIVRLVMRSAAAFAKNEPYSLADSLDALDDLGGVYIKFLQMVVLQMSRQAQNEFGPLLAVYEHSKPDNLDIVQHLRRVSPRTLDGLSELEREPFAAGSFGQVYHGKTLDGEDIIVKVLRPSVMRYLRYDLRLLGALTFVLGLFDKQRVFNYRSIYKEFRRTSLHETDYLREAAVAETYYNAYQDDPQLVIPKTYRNLSNKTVLVQECVTGISIAEVFAKQSQGYDPHRYVAQELGSDLFEQLYTVGFELLCRALFGQPFHADPHPGNIVLLPANRVALIDFGMTTVVNENRQAFYELLVQYGKFYDDQLVIEDFMLAALKLLAPELHDAMRQAGKLLGDNDDLLAHVRRVARQTVESDEAKLLMGNLMEQKMIMRILMFVVNKNNRFGFRFDMSSVITLKAVQTFIVLSLKLDPECQVIKQIVGDAAEHAGRHLDLVVDTLPEPMEPFRALEVLSTWFDRMARNDPWFTYNFVGRYMK